MSADEDKYPVESDRRRFVKGVVGSAAVAGLASTGAAAINTATPPSGSGGGTTQFMGIELVGGPAPRGMPQIPIRIADDGTIIGRWPEASEQQEGGQTVVVAEEEIGGQTYSSEWFQYCGIQTSPAIAPGADRNNTFVSAENPPYEWQGELQAGAPLNISDFDNYRDWNNGIGSSIGKPAQATWRSEDLDAADELVVLVIRSPLIEEAAQNDEWLAASTEQGVIAIMYTCTHFCCIPSFKSIQSVEELGYGDDVFCQCHESIYDPFTILQQQFTSLPRPDNLGSGGGG